MDNFFSGALNVLPVVASSPAALVAYIVTIGAYVYSASRVVRNRGLLKHLATLPEGDRLKALEIEMGQPTVTGGISAEQWLRAKIHRYYLLAFLVTALAIVVMFLLVLKHKEGRIDIDVTGYRSSAEPSRRHSEKGLASLILPSANAAEFEFDKPAGEEPEGGPYRVRYAYERSNGKLSIRPESDLLDAMAHEEVIEGVSYWHQPFSWDFPVLSVKVANNSPNTILLSEVTIEVRKSTVDVRPVLVIKSPSYSGAFHFRNEGWGKVVGPKVEMTISAPDCRTNPVRVSRTLDTFDDYGDVTIAKDVDPTLAARLLNCSDAIEWVCIGGMCTSGARGKCVSAKPDERTCTTIEPAMSGEETRKLLNKANRFSSKKYTAKDIFFRRVCDDEPACVQGDLRYKDEAGLAHRYRFKTEVFLREPGVGAPRPPTYSYDVFLRAGKSGYVERKAISQEIKPGEVDHFLLRVATDRSSAFDLKIDINDSGGKSLWQGNIDLAAFVPRSGAALALRNLEQGGPR